MVLILYRRLPPGDGDAGRVLPTNGQQMINGMIITLDDHAIYLVLHGRGGGI